jgi:molybdopterin-guanine dinucleotide biosynthesis protein A
MNNFLKNCTGVILAGGENKRMPVLKAFIEVEGKKIIERNLKLMSQLFKEIFIVTNQPEAYLYLRIPLFGDIYNIRGPMTGVFTALVNSSTPWVFISACDMPFLNERLIRYMYSKKNNFDAVVPRFTYSPKIPLNKWKYRAVKGKTRTNYTEPLFAFYSKSLLLLMEKAILAGKPAIKDFLKNKKVKYITVKEIKEVDPEGKSFVNLNTPEDIERYLQPQDVWKYKSKLRRRKTCLGLELQS